MFGKVLKYELKDGLRTFLPLWVAVIALALADGILVRLTRVDDSPMALSIAMTVVSVVAWVLIIGVFVVALVMIIRRFFHGLLGEGGYLAFSLPVRVETHVGGRLVCAMLMVIGCTVASVLAAWIIFKLQPENGVSMMSGFLQSCIEVIRKYPNSLLLGLEFILFLLLVLSYLILRLYSAMAIGHLFRKNREFFSILAYIAVGWAAKLVIAVLCLFTGKLLVAGALFGGNMSFETAEESIAMFVKCGGISIVLALVGNVLLWFVTTIILKKKLNIQ